MANEYGFQLASPRSSMRRAAPLAPTKGATAAALLAARGVKEVCAPTHPQREAPCTLLCTPPYASPPMHALSTLSDVRAQV